jgi:hypothetical protein
LSHSLNRPNTTPPSNEYVLSPPRTRLNSPNTRTPTCSPSQPNSASSRRVSVGAELGVIGELSSRPISVSSTTQLLPGATPSPQTGMHSSSTRTPTGSTRRPSFSKSTNSKTNELWCWHCQFEKACEKMGQWWQRSTNFFCFICCGFEIDEEMGVHHGTNGAAFHRFDGQGDSEMLGPRIVILDSTPAVAV